jgi:hypothetical protein
MKRVTYLLMILVLPVMLFAQDRDYSNEPGYVDFGNLTQFENDDNITEVLLEENLLKMVSKMSKEDDPELTNLLGNLKLIKVNVFQVDDKNQKSVQNKITEIDKMLSGKNWSRIVKSKQKGEMAYVYIKEDSNNKIAGLVVTTIQDKGEAAFINIVGQIDLEQIGKLGDKFNIPDLNGIDKK